MSWGNDNRFFSEQENFLETARISPLILRLSFSIYERYGEWSMSDTAGEILVEVSYHRRALFKIPCWTLKFKMYGMVGISSLWL